MLHLLMAVTMVLFVVVNFHIQPSSREEEIRYQEMQMMGINPRPVEDMHVQVGNGPDSSINTSDTEQIQREIRRINEEQFVQNLNTFGLALGLDSIVMVVQVHNRVDHLRLLVESLQKVRNIEQVLLIVSHDVFSHELNSLVLQIFFPYSQQIYHDRFPGNDPNDCPRDIKKDQALIKKCNNAEYPDKYGHYRESKYCQTKHHWIWKLQFVFERVRLLEGYGGHVLLLEDDYYVSEDILFSLKMMNNLRNK
nr:hypothetical protein BaRGS_031185 [Batillaria attramentaria]